MPNNYYPQGSLVSPSQGYARVALIATTNAVPVECTVGSTETYTNGDTIEIAGCSASALNALWQITVIDSTHFYLNNTTAPGATSSTSGYVNNYQLLPAMSLISDGTDDLNGANLNPPIEAAGNLGPFLYRAAGKYRLYDVYSLTNDSTYGSYWSTTTLSANAPATLAGCSALFGFTASGTAPILSSTDVLDVTVQTSLSATAAGLQGFTIFPAITAAGGGSPTRIPGTTMGLVVPAGGTLQSSPLTIRTAFPLSSIGGYGPAPFDLALRGSLLGTVTNNVTVNLIVAYAISIYHYKAN